MTLMRAALIPMKDLAGAKMRLAGVLDADARATLALAMLDDVLAAVRASGRFETVAVVSADAGVRSHAASLGSETIDESLGEGGLNAGLQHAVLALEQRDTDELVILPADVPLAQPDDIATVADALASGAAPRVVLVRAGDHGTNALGLRPPGVIPMRFGRRSADAHRDAAAAASVDAIELELPRLAFDVDGPDDLPRLASGRPGPATERWLAEHNAALHVHTRKET